MEQEKKADILVMVRSVCSRTTGGDSHIVNHSQVKAGSQISGATTLDEDEAGKLQRRWYRGGVPTLLKRYWLGASKRSKKHKGLRWLLAVVFVLGFFGVIVAIIYISIVGRSGLDEIVSQWKEPDANGPFKYEWRDDFSRDIVPKKCHSHNDYWRRVPMYQALAAGCTSIEADIWLTDDQELLVGHTWSSTRRYRSLRSLYLDPLTNIFEHRNISTASTSNKETGLFDTDPNSSTILLIDVKTDGNKIWPILLSQLQSLRDKNWLTYYDGTTLHQGPLTIVGSGKTPFELVQQNSTNRYIFYDAPLRSVSETQYNTTNSYYASANLKAAMGGLWLGRFTQLQKETLKQQIRAAEEKGLKSRYWDTPAWPIGMRDSAWLKLVGMGVGVLNVDDLISATRWNWGMCVVAGFVLCGNS
ncbi:PLC-like phosphodiesterase [Phaeosphaeriaceae sp. PMI808]|nr:PLC-like phosphodiesterase [Phaeosphaeriaceae sp. PMI808]